MTPLKHVTSTSRLNQSMGELEGANGYQSVQMASVTNRKQKLGMMSQIHLSRAAASRSVLGGYSANIRAGKLNTLHASSSNPDLEMNHYSAANRSTLGTSPSSTKLEQKFQRSQVNINNKMKDDFERLQKQLKARETRDKTV